MPWNGSGAFNRTYSWVADRMAGIKIVASRVDEDTNDIVSNGFGNCLTRDGQGAATGNQPMSGFRHTGAGNAVASGDYVTLAQATPGPVSLPGFAHLGDIKPTAIPEAILPSGWYVCAGQTRNRTDPLWLATGAVNAAYWLWGNGNGTTTYTLPDFRGRSLFGKDDMGGSAASRVTNGVSGIAGATLGAVGGNQILASHLHAVTITDGGHSHGTTESPHTHTVTDPGHVHSITDQAYVGSGGGAATVGAGATFGNKVADVNSAKTGVTNQTASTGLTVNSGTTGITAVTQTAGTGGSQNMPPAGIINFIICCGA